MPRSVFPRICAASLFGFAGISSAFSPTLPLYARELGATASQLGLIMGIAPFVGVFVRLPAGALSTVLGRRKLLMAGSFLFTCAPLLLMTTRSLWMLALVCFLYGFATLYMPAAVALVHDTSEPGRAVQYLGWYTMFAGLGRAIGPEVAGWILKHFGYAHVYLVCAGLGLLSFLITMTIRAPHPPNPSSGAGAQAMADLRAVVTRPRLITASVARLFQTLPLGVMTAFFPVYAKEVAGLNEVMIGHILTAQSLASLAGRPASAALTSRIGRIPLMTLGMIAGGVVLYLLTLATDFTLLLVFACLIGASEAATQIATIAYVSDEAGKRLFGAAIGIVGSMFDVGLVAGRLIPGFLLPLAPWSLAFGSVAALLVAAAGAVALLLGGRPPAQKAPFIDA